MKAQNTFESKSGDVIVRIDPLGGLEIVFPDNSEEAMPIAENADQADELAALFTKAAARMREIGR